MAGSGGLGQEIMVRWSVACNDGVMVSSGGVIEWCSVPRASAR